MAINNEKRMAISVRLDAHQRPAAAGSENSGVTMPLAAITEKLKSSSSWRQLKIGERNHETISSGM